MPAKPMVNVILLQLNCFSTKLNVILESEISNQRKCVLRNYLHLMNVRLNSNRIIKSPKSWHLLFNWSNNCNKMLDKQLN